MEERMLLDLSRLLKKIEIHGFWSFQLYSLKAAFSSFWVQAAWYRFQESRLLLMQTRQNLHHDEEKGVWPYAS
jgi:hypothetical protein